MLFLTQIDAECLQLKYNNKFPFCFKVLSILGVLSRLLYNTHLLHLPVSYEEKNGLRKAAQLMSCTKGNIYGQPKIVYLYPAVLQIIFIGID